MAGHLFLWYVADDIDGQGPVLHLFRADKSLTVTYVLAGARHYPGQAPLVVTGRGAVLATPDPPGWGTRSVATPALVQEIAEWALALVRRRPGGPI